MRNNKCKWNKDGESCDNQPLIFSKYCMGHENKALYEKIKIALDALEMIAKQQYGRPTDMMVTAREALKKIKD